MTHSDAGPDATGQGLFAFGFGYCAAEIAQRAAAAGWRVGGTARDPGAKGGAPNHSLSFRDGSTDLNRGVRRKADPSVGVEPLVAFGPDAPPVDWSVALEGFTHLLLSIPPGEVGDPALNAAGPAIAASPTIRWIGYLSTTGVYGDCGGAWVDEETPPRPSRLRSQRRVTAEEGWRALGAEAGKTVEIFRLGGIYGPGRTPFAAIRRGEAKRIHLPGRLFGRIHRDDVAAAVLAAMAAPVANRIVNLVDDCPVEPQAVTAYACALLGITPPPLVAYEAADLSPMARSFYEDDRRVRNAKLKAELLPRLYAPTFVEGLRALVESE